MKYEFRLKEQDSAMLRDLSAGVLLPESRICVFKIDRETLADALVTLQDASKARLDVEFNDGDLRIFGGFQHCMITFDFPDIGGPGPFCIRAPKNDLDCFLDGMLFAVALEMEGFIYKISEASHFKEYEISISKI